MNKDFGNVRSMFTAYSGFALIEILVAVSVLAIALVVIFQLFSGGLKSRQLSEKYSRGVFHAREKMAEALLIPDLSVGENRGEFEDGYQWDILVTEVKPEEDEDNLSVGLMDVKVQIGWFEDEKAKSFVIETLKIVKKERTVLKK